MTRSVNLLLIVALVSVALMTRYLRRDETRRNSEFLPGMVVSIPYNAQDSNPNFADGKTLRTPVAGTVAKGYPPLHYRQNPEDARRAGEELLNPIPDSASNEVDRGAAVFAAICTPCHGAGGLGDGTVTRRGFPPPPSLLTAKARSLKNGQMFHILTYGQNNMPPLVSQVTRMDRWRAIMYVRTLQQKSPPEAGK